MNNRILTLAAALAVAGTSASAQIVVEDWIIPGGSGAASGNAWLDSTNAGRGIDFISATAAQNTEGEALVAVVTGTGGTDNVQLLAADDGANLGSFAMTATGDATLSHYRLATSEDGYIFINGFGGTVQQYTVAGGAPVEVVADEIYATLSPAPEGNSRALEVTGSVADGTAKIFVGKGPNVVVFQNSPGNTATFEYAGHFDTGFGADIVLIGSHDGATVYTGLSTGVPLKKHTVSYSPFSATTDGEVAGFAAFAKQGVALNADNTLVAVAEGGGAEDGFAIANVADAGLSFNNLAPAEGTDSDGDSVYDAGAVVLNSPSFVVDTAMDPATGEVYAYSAGDGTFGAVANIRVEEPPANVSNWAIY